MDNISGWLRSLLVLVRSNLRKIFAAYIFACVFFFVFFPFSDLGPLISQKVNESTQGGLTLQFQEMSPRLLTGFGAQLKDAIVLTSSQGSYRFEELNVTTSVLQMLLQKLSLNIFGVGQKFGQFSINAQLSPFPLYSSLFSGGFDANQLMGPESKTKVNLDWQIKDARLQTVLAQMRIPARVDGQVNLQGTGSTQLNFADQPNASIQGIVNDFKIDAGQLATQMGMISYPGLLVGDLEVDAKLEAGSLQIIKLKGGNRSADVFFEIDGTVGLTLGQNRFGGYGPQLGSYDIRATFSFDAAKAQELSFALSILDSYVKDINGRKEYSISLRANSTREMPTIRPR